MVPDLDSGTWERGEAAVAGPGQADADRGPGESRERVVSRDEESVGWGDERLDASDDDDVARLLADRPPHHDRD